MSAAITFDVLMDGALRLPVEERSRLASRLIESLDDDESALSPEWQQEIERRIDAVKAGAVPRIPHEEVMSGVRQLLAQHQSGPA